MLTAATTEMLTAGVTLTRTRPRTRLERVRTHAHMPAAPRTRVMVYVVTAYTVMAYIQSRPIVMARKAMAPRKAGAVVHGCHASTHAWMRTRVTRACLASSCACVRTPVRRSVRARGRCPEKKVTTTKSAAAPKTRASRATWRTEAGARIYF